MDYEGEGGRVGEILEKIRGRGEAVAEVGEAEGGLSSVCGVKGEVDCLDEMGEEGGGGEMGGREDGEGGGLVGLGVWREGGEDFGEGLRRGWNCHFSVLSRLLPTLWCDSL